MRGASGLEKKKIIAVAGILILMVAALAAAAIGIIMMKENAGPSGSSSTENRANDRIPEYINMDIDVSSYSKAVAFTAGRPVSGEGYAEERKTTLTGTRQLDFDVLTFFGRGANAEWIFDLSETVSDPIFFQVTEVHDADLRTFGYTILIDGSETYFRTYEPISSSPNCYFFAVRRSDVSDLKNVRVRIVGEGKNPFSIADVVAYRDIFSSFEEEGLSDKMTVYLHSAGSTDLAKQHAEDFSGAGFTNVVLGLMFKLNYMNDTDDNLISQLAGFVSVASENGMLLQLMPSLSWSQPNDCADGKGGSFTDVKYGQVLYNSLTGEYVDSTPNGYGSTQWCSWGHPDLLTAQGARIKSLWDRVNMQMNHFAANGIYTSALSTLIEHSVVYKGPLPQSAYYTMGAIDGGDFNPTLVLAAKADGVNLDPTDGLSYEEKLWMNSYQAKYVQNLADRYNEAYGTDPIIVSGDNVTYPTTQRADGIFSHTVQWIDQTPSHGDMRISGWKSGIGNNFYEASEEFPEIDDIRFYQYRVAYGLTGDCNFEMSSLNNPNVFRSSYTKLYEAGVSFVTLFNDRTEYGTANTLSRLDSSINGMKSSGAAHYDVALLDADYNRDAASDGLLTPAFGVYSSENVMIDTSNGWLCLEKSGEGYVVYRVENAGKSIENGIYFDVEGYLRGSGSGIEVYGGKTPDSLKKIGDFRFDASEANSFNRNSTARYDVTSDTKGAGEYYIKIVLKNTGEPERVSLRGVSAYTPFGKTSGQLNGVTLDVGQARKLNLWISYSASALRMAERYLNKSGEKDAYYSSLVTLIENGCIGNASRLASEGMSKILPSSFAVYGEGRLGELPVYVQTSSGTSTGTVTVYAVSKTGAEFTVGSAGRSAVSRRLRISFTDFESGYYVIEKTGFNAFSVKKAEKGTEGAVAADETGKVTFSVQAEITETVKYESISGRVAKIVSGTTMYLTVQDPGISGYCCYTEVNTENSTVFVRKAYGSDEGKSQKPQAGDYVTVTYDGNGRAVRVEAVYGEKTGVIESFALPDLTDPDTTNGVITLEDGTQYELEYQAYTTAVTSRGNTVKAREMTDDDMKYVFAPGKNVSITFCPEFYGKYQRILTITIE